MLYDMADSQQISKSSIGNHFHQFGYVSCFDDWLSHKAISIITSIAAIHPRGEMHTCRDLNYY